MRVFDSWVGEADDDGPESQNALPCQTLITTCGNVVHRGSTQTPQLSSRLVRVTRSLCDKMSPLQGTKFPPHYCMCLKAHSTVGVCVMATQDKVRRIDDILLTDPKSRETAIGSDKRVDHRTPYFRPTDTV